MPLTEEISMSVTLLSFPQVVEAEYVFGANTHSIYNTSALAMLLRWLPSLGGEMRAWFVERLCDVITFSAHNWQRCCGAGLVRVVGEVLAGSQEEGVGAFSEEVEGECVRCEGVF